MLMHQVRGLTILCCHMCASVHILFKKWELRALGSSLAVNRQSWKTVELSFLHHDPTLYSPVPGAVKPPNQRSRLEERRQPPPPVFDGSMDHKPLQLTLTSAALAALFNFIKLIDVWFVFMKGATRPTKSACTALHSIASPTSTISSHMLDRGASFQWKVQSAPCVMCQCSDFLQGRTSVQLTSKCGSGDSQPK